MSEYLELEIRRKIYTLLKKNPGVHLSKIAELLDLRISHVEYHLDYLKKNEVVTAEKETGYLRYYIKKTAIGPREKHLLSILRQNVPLQIVAVLLQKSKARHKEILNDVTVAPSTLSYHLQKMMDQGIITCTLSDQEKEYSLLNEKEIIQIIVRYKPYKVLESFKDIWANLDVE